MIAASRTNTQGAVFLLFMSNLHLSTKLEHRNESFKTCKIVKLTAHHRLYSQNRNSFCGFMLRKTLDIGSPCGRLLARQNKKTLAVRLFCPICRKPHGDWNLYQEFRETKKHPAFADPLRFCGVEPCATEINFAYIFTISRISNIEYTQRVTQNRLK